MEDILFMYLAFHRRTWTADRRKRHALQDSDECALCSQDSEMVEHLFLHCPVAKQVRWNVLSTIQLQQHFVGEDLDLYVTWSRMRAGLAKTPKKGLDSIFMLITWSL